MDTQRDQDRQDGKRCQTARENERDEHRVAQRPAVAEVVGEEIEHAVTIDRSCLNAS